MSSNIKIAIPKEIFPNEQRVSLIPLSIPELKKFNCELLLQKGAGLGAAYPDENYGEINTYENAATLYAEAKIILKVQPPTEKEIALIPEHAIVIGFMAPDRNLSMVTALRDKKITSFAVELIPRISRAQNMDALSSQASVAGYKAALIAANLSKRFFPDVDNRGWHNKTTNSINSWRRCCWFTSDCNRKTSWCYCKSV